jgi:hypothetical protein
MVVALAIFLSVRREYLFNIYSHICCCCFFGFMEHVSVLIFCFAYVLSCHCFLFYCRYCYSVIYHVILGFLHAVVLLSLISGFLLFM